MSMEKTISEQSVQSSVSHQPNDSGRHHVGRSASIRTERQRRFSGATVCMVALVKNEHGADGIAGFDLNCPGIVQPVIMQFFEHASSVIKEQSAGMEWHLAESRAMQQSLQETLTHGSNFATLAGMLWTSTFGMKSRQLDRLIGPDVSAKVRKELILGLSKVIDTLWERFGLLLVERYRSFEEAFKQLDHDVSGFVDREEFVHAYVDIHLEAAARDREISSANAHESAIEARLKVGRATTLDLEGLARRQKKAPTSSVNRINEMILTTEAGVMFDMLLSSDEGMTLGKSESESNPEERVSMQHLVMRLAGLNHQAMESLREQIATKYMNLQSLFSKFAKPHAMELTREEFERMYQSLWAKQAEPSEAAPEGAPQVYSLETAAMSDADVSAMATRIFNGIDTDGSGRMTVSELQQALAAFGPTTSFSVFRRRVLLHHGSFENFFMQLPNGGWCSPEQISIFAFNLDINAADWLDFLRRLGLADTTNEEIEAPCPTVPCCDYSVEEFAISAFLNKPEDMTIEDLLLKNRKADRDRDISLQEFSERWVSGVQKEQDELAHVPASSASGASALASAAKRAVAGKKPGGPEASPLQRALRKGSVLTLPMKKGPPVDPRRVGSPKPAPAGLMVTCRLQELKAVYAALEREHRRVTVNVLLRSMANVSDVIALDRTAYQAGDVIVCRVRLSVEGQKRCKERPFVAMVPERLEWKGHGRAGGWTLNGERSTDLASFGGTLQELPHGPNGGVPRELCLRMMAPLVLAAEPRHEMRLLASSNGREPAKQVGRSVTFDLLMPAPQKPHVDHIELNSQTGDASVVLHWSTPPGNFESLPIVNFVVQVEPLIYSHALVVDQGDVPLQSEEPRLQSVEVWSPTLKGFTKKLSYGIDGLKRGVQYRFGVQCVHARPWRPEDEEQERTEVRGAPSELSDVAMMPFYHVTEAPEVPRVEQSDDGTFQLVWKAPQDEGMSDANRICSYRVQYRHSVAGSTTVPDEESDGKEKADEKDLKEEGEEEEEEEYQEGSQRNTSVDEDRLFSNEGSLLPTDPGWVDVDETKVFIAQPRWADFVGWEVVSHIQGLKPIDGKYDDHEHEFRVCAVNLAGNSPWSKPSAPITFATAAPLEQPTQPSDVTDLQVLEVRGYHATGDKTKGEVRSQCRLRWMPPVTAKPHDPPRYSILVRDATHIRSEGGWLSATTYHLCNERVAWSAGRAPASERRRSSLQQAVEVLVSGLERFPPFATLALQVRATTFHWTSTAEVVIPGVEMPRPLPPPGPPELVQVLEPSTAGHAPTASAHEDEVVELRWPVVESTSGSPHYVLQAASASKPELEDDAGARKTLEWKDLKWSDYVQIKDASISVRPPSQEKVSEVRCFVRGLDPLQLWRFRVCVAGADGILGPPSRASEMPFQFPSSMIRGDSEQPVPVFIPDRPQSLKVVHVDKGYCELSWEQRMPTLRTPPTRCEVQLCRDDMGEDNWETVRCTYVCSEEGETDDLWKVKAAAFFKESLLGQGSSGPHWRVRARTGASEWSIPTLWQLPPRPPPPPVCSALKVASEELQHYILEWTYESKDGQNGVQYTVQAQGCLEPKAGKDTLRRLTDWAPVPAFTAPIAVAGTRRKKGARAVRALVERRAVAEALGAAEEAGGVHFRVVLDSAHGARGEPSEPSEEVPLQVELPPAAAPEALEFAGQGRLLLENAGGAPQDVEFVRLQWRQPPPEEGGDSERTAALASGPEEDVSYSLEIEDIEADCWAPLPGALLELRSAPGGASALALLPPAHGGQRRGRLRVAARRRPGLAAAALPGCARLFVEPPAVCSPPSPAICWGLAVELPRRPTVTRAVSNRLSLRFSLSGLAARPGLCVVSALVEVANAAETGSRPSSPGQEDASYFVSEGTSRDDQEDAQSEGSQAGEFSCIGEFPVYWQFARTDGSDKALRSSAHLTIEDLQGSCAGVVVLDGDRALTVGDSVRVMLQVRAVGGSALEHPGRPSAPVQVEHETVSSAGAPILRLEYPSWTGFVSPGGHTVFRPCLHVGCRAPPGPDKAGGLREDHIHVRDKVLNLAADDRPRLHFELVASGDDGFKEPAGGVGKCSVDAETGVLVVEGAGVEALLHFTVQVFVLSPWLSTGGLSLTQGAAATAKLTGTALENTVYTSLCEMLQGSPVRKLAEEGSSVGAVLRNPRLLSTYSLLHSTCESIVGKSAIELVEVLLRLPPDAITLAAELSEQELAARLTQQRPNEAEGSEKSGSDGSDLEDGLGFDDSAGSDRDMDVPDGDDDPPLMELPVQRRATIDPNVLCLSSRPGNALHESSELVSLPEVEPNRAQSAGGTKDAHGLDVSPTSRRSQAVRPPALKKSTKYHTMQDVIEAVRATTKLHNEGGTGGIRSTRPSFIRTGSKHEGKYDEAPVTAVRSLGRSHHDRHTEGRVSLGSLPADFADEDGHHRRKSKSDMSVAHSENMSISRSLGEVRAGHSSHGRMLLDVSYPDLTPLWPAFADVEFKPVVKSFAAHGKGRRLSHELPPPDPGAVCFEVHPQLPAKVSIDPVTGVIRGSPMTEHMTGGQYTVIARWEDSHDIAARVAIAFAVVSADLAAVCNTAYLENQPPAFRPLQPPPETKPAMSRQVSAQSLQPAAAAGEENAVDPDSMSIATQTASSLPSSRPRSRGAGPLLLPAGEPQTPRQASTAPALLTDVEPLVLCRERATLSTSPGRRNVWRSRLRSDNLAAEPLGDGKSRKTVFPLGPPLQNRGASLDPNGGGAVALVHPVPPLTARSPRTRPVY